MDHLLNMLNFLTCQRSVFEKLIATNLLKEDRPMVYTHVLYLPLIFFCQFFLIVLKQICSLPFFRNVLFIFSVESERTSVTLGSITSRCHAEPRERRKPSLA